MKGWRYEGYRHSLAARGIRTNMMGRHKDYHPSATSPHFVEDKTTLEGIYAFLDKPGNELLSDEVLAEELHDKFHGLTGGRAEALVERHRKSNFAVVGFSPEIKERILRVLAQNPQLKSKVEATTKDIVSGTSFSETGRASNVNTYGQVWWITPEKRARWEAALIESERLRKSGASPSEVPAELKETISQIPGYFYEDKLRFMKHPERSQMWTIYLTNALETGRIKDPYYKELILKYGPERGMDEYIKGLLEHEVTHEAHGEKIPDFLDKMHHERDFLWEYLGKQKIPVSAFKEAGVRRPYFEEVMYFSEPTEQLSRKYEEKLVPGLRRQKVFDIVAQVSPEVIARRKGWEDLLKASPKPKLRALPRKWQIGEGEEEYFSEVSPEEASVNLSYLE